MKGPVDRAERIYFNWFAAVVGGALLLGLGLWGGLTALHHWQERHLVRRAAAYFSGGDFKTASINARRALQLDPRSVGAARVLGEIAEHAGDGTELDWRRKVVELEPASVDDAIALVRAQLRSNQLVAAEKTLRSLGDSAANQPTYHAAWGRLSEMRKDPVEAERHWAKAVDLAPANAAFRMQLALVELGFADEKKRAAAVATLEALRADPTQRAAATRALIIDGAAHQADAQRLASLARELQNYPEKTFKDQLLYAEILRQLHAPDYPAYLANLEKEAVLQAANLGSLISWMNGNGQTAEALKLVGSVSADTLSKWPVPAAVAETYANAADWTGMRQFVMAREWPGFEFLRHAYLARAARAEKAELDAGEQWVMAQKIAANKPQPLLMLARTVSAWGWETEKVELLWAISKNPDARAEALQDLYQHYATRGDTSGLYRVLARSIEVAPDDLTVQNNLAQISLLLGADVERARKLASDLVRKEPANADYVATFAYSLYTQGDVAGALSALQQLSPAQLERPSISAYYGIVLVAAGEKEKARQYLERGKKAFLLPEERALLEKAEALAR
ncbi:MAG: hypothetical protein M3Z64_07730 [Verrucomicrobiota bacterium]|nr:hypothetical protein [Verrucomicrobiota bacterium]